MKHRHSLGITYIEIILVVGILIILTGATIPFFSNFILRVNTDLTVDAITSAIRKAQNYSIDAKNNASWKVCKTGNTIRLYTGTCAAPTIKEDTSIASNITVTGLSDTTFSKFRGEPSVASTITVSSAIKTRIIILNIAGGLDIN